MVRTYEVWIEGDGDIFKGYDNKYVSTHLDKRAADIAASSCNGYIETNDDNLHPDYIAQLEANDTTLINDKLLVI